LRPNEQEISPAQIVTALRRGNLLPAIVFLPTRRRCDEAALEVSLKTKSATGTDERQKERQEKRRVILQQFSEENPEIATHKHRQMIVRGGVAAHHAGHIPAWKLVIEKMMSAGLLDAIFATSTVAAGVDFPARTVVITNADTRGNDGWRPLRASELQQMTGRAGRRGKDNVGFAVAAPGRFQNPGRLAFLLRSQPDALQSQFRATYTSLLNLLDAFGGFAQVREIAERSFAFRETGKQITKLDKERSNQEEALRKKLNASGFNLTIETARGLERLAAARMRLQERLPETRADARRRWLSQEVAPGRLISQGKSGKRLFLVLQAHGEKVAVMRDDGQGATLPLSRVNRIYARHYPLRQDALENAIMDVYDGKNPPLEEPKLKAAHTDEQQAVDILNGAMERLLPEGADAEQRKEIFKSLWDGWDEADRLDALERDIEGLRGGVWLPFERRAQVLNHFGYLDLAAEKVTERGKWLADVRVDRPLLVGEALRHGLFAGLEIKHTAALMAALAADSDRNYGDLEISGEVGVLLGRFAHIIDEVAQAEWKFGVEPTPELNYSAAAAAELWAGGTEWDDLVEATHAEEGDLVRLLSRTGEALLQIAALKTANLEAAEAARAAAEAILREPVR
jgi:superfamily II RNA helicase